MENKINLVELLKDCPKGMELDCTLYDNCTFEEIDDVGYIYIVINTPSGRIRLNKEGCYIRYDKNAKCVIFPKGKTTWNGFVPPCKFKDGDIISDNRFNSVCIFKGEGNAKGTVDFYCGISGISQVSGSDDFIIKDVRCKDAHFGYINEYNLATEKEKQKLFQTIKEKGYRWNVENKALEKIKERKFDIKTCLNCKTFKDMHQNCPYSPIWRYKDLNEAKSHLRDETDCQFWNEIPKTKTLEKVVEPKFKVGDRIRSVISLSYYTIVDIKDDQYVIQPDEPEKFPYHIDFGLEINYELVPKFDINTLKPFESKVLVRNADGDLWKPAIYGFSHSQGCYVVGGVYWKQCILYEANKELLGTTNNIE